MSNEVENCPCGSEKPYNACCGVYHAETSYPETAEALMRSRYSAYVKKEVHYLFRTTHPNFREQQLRQSLSESVERTTWLGLEIQETQMGQVKDKIGKVRFIATFSEGPEIHEFREHSRFKRYQGKWHYCDAISGSRNKKSEAPID